MAPKRSIRLVRFNANKSDSESDPDSNPLSEITNNSGRQKRKSHDSANRSNKRQSVLKDTLTAASENYNATLNNNAQTSAHTSTQRNSHNTNNCSTAGSSTVISLPSIPRNQLQSSSNLPVISTDSNENTSNQHNSDDVNAANILLSFNNNSSNPDISIPIANSPSSSNATRQIKNDIVNHMISNMKKGIKYSNFDINKIEQMLNLVANVEKYSSFTLKSLKS